MPASRSGRIEERVLLGLAPAGEDETAARLEALAQVGERARRIGEEHDAEPRRHEVGAVGLEVVDGGVGAFEPDDQVLGRPLAGARQHRLGNVEPQHLAAGTDAGGEVDRRRAAAAADVDHAIARLWRRDGDEPVGNRAQNLILMFLVVGPSLSGAGVPVLGLRGIVGVDWRRGHGASSFGARCAFQFERGFRSETMGAAMRALGDVV